MKNIFKKSPAVLLILGTAASVQAEERPNILLILSDDHSVPFLGCYGYPDISTPNLDRLASEGIVYDNVYTAASQSVPSRASIMTGRSVVDVRMTRFSAPLSREIPVFPEALRKQGYYTGICGRLFHLDGSNRKADGDEEIFEKHHLRTFEDRVDYVAQGRDHQVLGQFKKFVEGCPKKSPFFMWMNFSDPHRAFNAYDFEPAPETMALPEIFPDSPEVRKDLAGHIGEINRLDTRIGEVFDYLDARGLKANTIIIFMGDNGSDLLRGKGTLYNLGLQVPLIIAGPGVDKGKRSEAFISGEDIAPTILDMAGVKHPEKMTGISFYPTLKSQQYKERDYCFAIRGSFGLLPENQGAYDIIRTVFNRRYKLIYNVLWQIPYEPLSISTSALWTELKDMAVRDKLSGNFAELLFREHRPMFELYNRETDPCEFHNLIDNPEYEDVVIRLKMKLQEWMILNQDYAPLPLDKNNKRKRN